MPHLPLCLDLKKVQVLACAKSTGKPLGKRHLVCIEIALLGKFVQPHAPQHLNVAVQDLCLGTFLQWSILL